MQTFLPFRDYRESASVLDRLRLGKQRVECFQLLKVLHGETSAWKHHPAVKMWKGYEQSLIEYGIAICHEWIARGYKDTCLGKIEKYIHYQERKKGLYVRDITKPIWLNDEFCSSHRATLLAKNKEWYAQFGWEELPEIRNYWPINNETK